MHRVILCTQLLFIIFFGLQMMFDFSFAPNILYVKIYFMIILQIHVVVLYRNRKIKDNTRYNFKLTFVTVLTFIPWLILMAVDLMDPIKRAIWAAVYANVVLIQINVWFL